MRACRVLLSIIARAGLCVSKSKDSAVESANGRRPLARRTDARRPPRGRAGEQLLLGAWVRVRHRGSSAACSVMTSRINRPCDRGKIIATNTGMMIGRPGDTPPRAREPSHKHGGSVQGRARRCQAPKEPNDRAASMMKRPTIQTPPHAERSEAPDAKRCNRNFRVAWTIWPAGPSSAHPAGCAATTVRRPARPYPPTRHPERSEGSPGAAAPVTPGRSLGAVRPDEERCVMLRGSPGRALAAL